MSIVETAKATWYRAIVREYGARAARCHWHECRYDLLTATPELEALYRAYLAAIEQSRQKFIAALEVSAR